MEIEFSEDIPFEVKNSVGILLFMILCSTVLFIASLSSPDGLPVVAKLYLAFPAIAGIIGLIFRQPLIIVDKNGIIASGQRITRWENFVSADFTDNMVAGSYKDNFCLLVEHSKPNFPGCFVSTIALTNTENMSEEAVLAAIKFFYDKYRETHPAANKPAFVMPTVLEK